MKDFQTSVNNPRPILYQWLLEKEKEKKKKRNPLVLYSEMSQNIAILYQPLFREMFSDKSM